MQENIYKSKRNNQGFKSNDDTTWYNKALHTVYSNTDKKHNKEKTNQNQQFNNTKNSVVTNQVCVFQ